MAMRFFSLSLLLKAVSNKNGNYFDLMSICLWPSGFSYHEDICQFIHLLLQQPKIMMEILCRYASCELQRFSFANCGLG